MVSTNEFKTGLTVTIDNDPWQVVEFQHVKPGKGAAFVRTKLRNVITGAVIEKTFSPTDKYNDARIERRDMQYLYNDGDLYYFMDLDTYEQVPIGQDLIGDNFKFVKEEMICKIISYKDKPFAVEPPMFVELDVIDTEPDFKRDNVLDHAEVVVRRARAQHEILRTRPEVRDIYRSVQLLGKIHATNPPTGLVRRREGKRLLFAALESADARDRRIAENRLSLRRERRRAILGKTRLVYRLDVEALVGRRNRRGRAEHCLSDSV